MVRYCFSASDPRNLFSVGGKFYVGHLEQLCRRKQHNRFASFYYVYPTEEVHCLIVIIIVSFESYPNLKKTEQMTYDRLIAYDDKCGHPYQGFSNL